MLRVTTSLCPQSHKHPPHPWCFGTEAFVGRRWNILSCSRDRLHSLAMHMGDLGVLCSWGRKTTQSRARGRQKRRTNHAQRTWAQAKPFPECISWLAQLLPPESSLPAFPAGLFLPPLDGSGAAATPLRASGGHTDQLLSLVATGAARAVTNRPSLHSSVTSRQHSTRD